MEETANAACGNGDDAEWRRLLTLPDSDNAEWRKLLTLPVVTVIMLNGGDC